MCVGVRDLDGFDYAVVAAIAALAYLQLPWRPTIRARLRTVADHLGGAAAAVTNAEPWVYALVGLVLGAVAVVAIVESPALLVGEDRG